MDLRLPLRPVARLLFGVPLVLFAIAAPLEWLRSQRGWTSLVTDLFRLSGESTIPTWYSSFLLLACGTALLIIARVRERRADWALLGAIFVYMSVDELVQIHELLNGTAPLTGAIYFGWVLPATAVVILLAVRFVPFLLALPARRRRQFFVAGAVYIGAALALEVPLGQLAVSDGLQSFAYRLLDTVEEALEIVGLSLFLVALLEEMPPFSVTVVRGSPSAPDR